jgi:ubiquitin-conjugating enzyme E2 D/E
MALPVGSKTAKRLAKELADCQSDPPTGCTFALVGDNLMHWECTVAGPSDTPYEGGIFRLDVNFPSEYPFRAPKVQFKTKIYHCNISETGYICLDILKDQWSPAFNCAKVMLSILALLQEPNPSDPLSPHIARQMKDDKKAFLQSAKEWTKRYAIPK